MNIDIKNLLITTRKILVDNWKVNHTILLSKFYQQGLCNENFS